MFSVSNSIIASALGIEAGQPEAPPCSGCFSAESPKGTVPSSGRAIMISYI